MDEMVASDGVLMIYTSCHVRGWSIQLSLDRDMWTHRGQELVIVIIVMVVMVVVVGRGQRIVVGGLAGEPKHQTARSGPSWVSNG